MAATTSGPPRQALECDELISQKVFVLQSFTTSWWRLGKATPGSPFTEARPSFATSSPVVTFSALYPPAGPKSSGESRAASAPFPTFGGVARAGSPSVLA